MGYLELFRGCMSRLRTPNVSRASDVELKRVLDFLQYEHSILFEALWNIRVPFLTSEYTRLHQHPRFGLTFQEGVRSMAMYIYNSLLDLRYDTHYSARNLSHHTLSYKRSSHRSSDFIHPPCHAALLDPRQ